MAETTMTQTALPQGEVSPQQSVPQGMWAEFLGANFTLW